MTTNLQRRNAVQHLGELTHGLASIASRGKGENVLIPREMIEQMFRCLKHYPTHFDLETTAQKCPALWQ